MNKQEAIGIIKQQLEPYRKKDYTELVKMINTDSIAYELKAPSGVTYQIEILATWDDKPDGDIRVWGTIDDGGWRAFFPLSEAFIRNPKNDFVGE